MQRAAIVASIGGATVAILLLLLRGKVVTRDGMNLLENAELVK